MASQEIRSPEKVVYAVIVTVLAQGVSPTLGEVAEAVGAPVDVVGASVDKLVERGLLRRSLYGFEVSDPPPKAKPVRMTAKTVEGWYQEALRWRYAAVGELPPWGPKELKLARDLLNSVGPALLREAVLQYVTGFNRQPSWGHFYVSRETWLNAARERMFSRKSKDIAVTNLRATEDEHREAPKVSRMRGT